MGGLGLPKQDNGEEAPPVLDVSAEGTLVWLRRPNGSWWPSIVISPQDVPDGCAAPPRCRATPIMLLGRRRDGPTFVDWCNLDRCKRVKPFRCGELDFDQRITNALALAAAGNRSTWTYNKGRYARMEDAILQAVDIERARALDPATKAYLHGDTCSPTPKTETPDGQLKDAAPMVPSTATKPSAPPPPPPPPPNRKRKTPYDSEEDAPKGSRRMRDLRDIGSKTTVPPADLTHAVTVSVPKYGRVPCAGQVKTIAPSHAAAKRKHAAVNQDQPSGIPRKKDRSRALSELCNGDMWNGHRSNGQKADEHLLGVPTCSSGSSGTSTLDTSLDTTSCDCSAAFKTDQPMGTEMCCVTRRLGDDFSRGNGFVETPLPAQTILEPDHLQRYQPCGSTKSPTWKKQANDFSRTEKCVRKNIKMRTISSVDQEGNNRTRDSNGHGHHKTKTVKHKSPRDEVVLLEKRMDKRSLNKPSGHDTKTHLAVIPTDTDCVGAVQQQRSKSRCDPEESSESMSNRSNCESGSVSSLVFELPLQVLPPEKKALDLGRCCAVKPIKTMHLNPTLCDVELSVLGSSNTGRRVPLVSLMSKWNRRPVVGYPVSVEVCDDVFVHPLSSRDDQHPAMSGVDGILKRDETENMQCLVPSPPQACRAKPKSHSRKTLEKEVDKLWQPHTKKAASGSRKMRRLSSFASGQRDGNGRKSAVGKVSGAAIACIPLRVVFSRINEALSFPVK